MTPALPIRYVRALRVLLLVLLSSPSFLRYILTFAAADNGMAAAGG